MKKLSPEFSIIDLCSVLQVSRSGYYRWQTGTVGPRQTANLDLVLKIENIFKKHDENYGSPRITAQLKQQGTRCNHKRVERLMRAEGLRAQPRKRFRVVTTDSNHDHPIAPNRLPDTEITGRNQGWCSDPGRLALSGGRAGPLQPQDRGLGHGRSSGERACPWRR